MSTTMTENDWLELKRSIDKFLDFSKEQSQKWRRQAEEECEECGDCCNDAACHEVDEAAKRALNQASIRNVLKKKKM